ncbi:MAG: CDP-diacylglycerol--glycerol-3-phosphate 3-phosphatidyltransferase [Proteobacteria bacterium]|jgi:CDP-diacylglycerol--glycerol-3-phosphate 3-phosphatidyltransferase|nr:CDP-diacylglycerol--glycerol-3-phosphate 3-phosphatidyltransferase [Pseudomonadota bacterium]
MDPRKKIFNIPNLLTFIRILSIPFIVWLLRHPTPPSEQHLFWAAAIFGLSFITDQIDGIIARATNQITQLGKIMDPMADKILVVTALMLLIHMQFMAVWIAIVLSCRELVVSALRALAQSEGITLTPNWVGKTKAYFEGFGIAFVMLGPDQHFLGFNWYNIGMILLYLAVATALLSAVQYFRIYFVESNKQQA